MVRIFVFAFIYALLTAIGCGSFQPEPETKVVDRPDVAPMELPAIGWATSFTSTQDGSGMDEPVTSAPADFDVYLKQHASGVVADYGGFLIYVTGDVFSFQAKKYWAYSWYYGFIEITVEGAGDAAGAYIFVRGDYDGGWYTLQFELTHGAELETPTDEAAFVGPSQAQLTHIP